jgi:hypothetical protein
LSETPPTGGWDPPRPGWVCSECGFDYDATDPTAVADLVAKHERRYVAPLSRGLPDEDLDALLRAHPDAGGWSALEYACHVRDALALYDSRIDRVLSEERPQLPAMRRDEVAVERDYNGQVPAVVATEIGTAARGLADRLRAVPPDGWERVGVRDGEELSVAWMARNALHEASHHLLDIGRTLRHLRGR